MVNAGRAVRAPHKTREDTRSGARSRWTANRDAAASHNRERHAEHHKTLEVPKHFNGKRSISLRAWRERKVRSRR